jgi:hypothetical protein
MMNKGFCLILLLVIMVAGCVTPANTPEKPIGKGYVNLCISDPARADYWQKTDDILWNTPGNNVLENDRKTVTGFSSCDNYSVTIWEYTLNGAVEWSHVTLQTKEGRSYDGWLVADHVIQTSNETGTEWSSNYSSIVGLWDQTQRGNGAKIWYEFKRDGTFTFNYDMRGNGDNMRNTGSWTYLGNKTYQMISNMSNEPDTHGNENITISQDGKSFHSGTEYSSTSATGRDIVFAKE